jgi:hypothetical protein
MIGTITIETTDVPYLSVVAYGGDRNIGGFSFNNNDAVVVGVTINYEPLVVGPTTQFFENLSINANLSNPTVTTTITDPVSPTLLPGTYYYTIQADFQTYSGPIGTNTTGTVELCVGDC